VSESHLASFFRLDTIFAVDPLPWAARFSAQRRLVASIILMRPSGLNRRFLAAAFVAVPPL
jgi:hypothetical protein